MTRPPLSRSTVPTAEARSHGSHRAAGVSSVPSLIRVVTMLAAASVAHRCASAMLAARVGAPAEPVESRERTNAGVEAGPALGAPPVGVHVPGVAAARPSEAARRPHGRVPVHVHGHLVYAQLGHRLAFDVVDVLLLLPDLAGGPVDVAERRGQDRAEHVPRALAARVDELLVEFE